MLSGCARAQSTKMRTISLCIFGRAGIEKRLAVLVSQRRELLDRAHETPALTRINAGREEDRAAVGVRAALEDFAGAQHLARGRGEDRRTCPIRNCSLRAAIPVGDVAPRFACVWWLKLTSGRSRAGIPFRARRANRARPSRPHFMDIDRFRHCSLSVVVGAARAYLHGS